MNAVPVAVLVDKDLLRVIHNRLREENQQIIQFGFFHDMPRYALA